MLCSELEGWDGGYGVMGHGVGGEGEEGGDICIYTADSFCSTTETNTKL